MRSEHRLTTNCPNCGAIVSESGKCAYCGTVIRIANQLDITMTGAPVDIQINVRDGDKVIVIPFHGCLSSIDIEYPRAFACTMMETRAIAIGEPELELTLVGSVYD